MLVIVFCSGMGVRRGRTGAAGAVVTGAGQGTEGGVGGALSSTSVDGWMRKIMERKLRKQIIIKKKNKQKK